MTSSNGNIFRVTGPLCGEFTGPGEFPAQRPVTRSFDVYFDLRLNKRLCKQSWGWWIETLLCPLWRHSNELFGIQTYSATAQCNNNKVEKCNWMYWNEHEFLLSHWQHTKNTDFTNQLIRLHLACFCFAVFGMVHKKSITLGLIALNPRTSSNKSKLVHWI